MTPADPAIDHLVCYADTDAGGIVYHARFIDMAERARNRLMRLAGFSFASLASEYRVMLIVRRVDALYHAPALLEDLLTLRSRIVRAQPGRTEWVTEVTRDAERIASIWTEMVMLDIDRRQIARHPQALLDGLAPYLVPAGAGANASANVSAAATASTTASAALSSATSSAPPSSAPQSSASPATRDAVATRAYQHS